VRIERPIVTAKTLSHEPNQGRVNSIGQIRGLPASTTVVFSPCLKGSLGFAAYRSRNWTPRKIVLSCLFFLSLALFAALLVFSLIRFSLSTSFFVLVTLLQLSAFFFDFISGLNAHKASTCFLGVSAWARQTSRYSMKEKEASHCKDEIQPAFGCTPHKKKKALRNLN
jgi:hypothetical protein